MKAKFYCLLFALLFLFISVSQAQAQKSVNVKASVGKYYFSLSGYASPFASIVMRSNSISLASTVADPKGNFSIKRVLVNEGFTDFCLEVIDIKRIGDTFTCFKIPPVVKDTEKRNIFLPPTIGLSGKRLVPGSSIFASGYSMPNAEVIINISKDIIIKTRADKSGFYKIEIKDVPAGKYSLFATARYEKRDSEKPDKRVELESLSLSGLIQENLLLILLILLLVLIVIILIFILLSRRLRDIIRGLLGRKPVAKRRPNPLHHSWFIGF